MLDNQLADHSKHFGDLRSELGTVKVAVQLASAFTSSVQKEMQSLLEELRAPFTAVQKEVQCLREHSHQRVSYEF